MFIIECVVVGGGGVHYIERCSEYSANPMYVKEVAKILETLINTMQWLQRHKYTSS